MAVTSTGLPIALQEFALALDAFGRPSVTSGRWRWQVRQQLAALRDALIAETGSGTEGWTAAREGTVLRERNSLLTRVGSLAPRVLEDPDIDAVHGDLRRLLADVGRHTQRVHDLAYDEVELELGGSE